MLVPASIILFVYYIASIIINRPIAKHIHVIAHRGGAAYAPENTLLAFKNAIKQGVDWLEFEEQESKDGILVLYHNPTVDTLGVGIVNDYTYEELQAVDLGENQKIPKFEEVVLLAKRNLINILPEAKSVPNNPNLILKMIEIIEAHDYVKHTIVQSFSPEAIVQLHELAPNISGCMLYGLSNFRAHMHPPYPGDSPTLCLMSEMLFLNPAMVRQAHKAGRQVFVYPGIF
ncbi:MAG: glycerophosphodiester phosphodiesterase family protein [Chloroflexota bacterium]